MNGAKCIDPRVKNSPKCIELKITNMCLTLSPLFSIMYRAKCINLRVNNSPKCFQPNLDTYASPYPPWLVSCIERSVSIELTTPQGVWHPNLKTCAWPSVPFGTFRHLSAPFGISTFRHLLAPFVFIFVFAFVFLRFCICMSDTWEHHFTHPCNQCFPKI